MSGWDTNLAEFATQVVFAETSPETCDVSVKEPWGCNAGHGCTSLSLSTLGSTRLPLRASDSSARIGPWGIFQDADREALRLGHIGQVELCGWLMAENEPTTKGQKTKTVAFPLTWNLTFGVLLKGTWSNVQTRTPRTSGCMLIGGRIPTFEPFSRLEGRNSALRAC